MCMPCSFGDWQLLAVLESQHPLLPLQVVSPITWLKVSPLSVAITYIARPSKSISSSVAAAAAAAVGV